LIADVEGAGALVAHQCDGPLVGRAMGNADAVAVRAVEAGFELVQEADAIVELVGIDEGTEVFDAASRIVDHEGLMAGAQEAGAEAAIADGDKVGQRALRIADLLGSEGTEARVNQ